MAVRLAIPSTENAVERVHLHNIPFAFDIFIYVRPTGSSIRGEICDVDSKGEARRKRLKQSSGVMGRPPTMMCWALTETKYSMSCHGTCRRLDCLAAFYVGG